MDPSHIAATPLPLDRVTIFAALPAVVLLMYWLVKSPSTLTWNMMNLVKSTGIIYALFGLSGNYLVENWQLSLTTALYVATLLATTAKGTMASNLLEELPFHDVEDIVSTSQLYMTLLSTIPCLILTVLDHGKQIQRWPTPVLLGSTYGYSFGTLIGIMARYLSSLRKESKKLQDN